MERPHSVPVVQSDWLGGSPVHPERLPNEPSALRDRIVALFCDIEESRYDAADVELGAIINQIVLVGSRPFPNARASSYRASSQATARAELDHEAKLVDDLQACIEGWHEPAVVALADLRIMRHRIEPILSEFARACRNADVSKVPEVVGSPGRPRSEREMLIALLAIEGYELCRGIDTRVSGQARGLNELVEKIFDLAGIEPTSAKSAIATAAKHREKSDAAEKPLEK